MTQLHPRAGREGVTPKRAGAGSARGPAAEGVLSLLSGGRARRYGGLGATAHAEGTPLAGWLGIMPVRFISYGYPSVGG